MHPQVQDGDLNKQSPLVRSLGAIGRLLRKSWCAVRCFFKPAVIHPDFEPVLAQMLECLKKEKKEQFATKAIEFLDALRCERLSELKEDPVLINSAHYFLNLILMSDRDSPYHGLFTDCLPEVAYSRLEKLVYLGILARHFEALEKLIQFGRDKLSWGYIGFFNRLSDYICSYSIEASYNFERLFIKVAGQLYDLPLESLEILKTKLLEFLTKANDPLEKLNFVSEVIQSLKQAFMLIRLQSEEAGVLETKEGVMLGMYTSLLKFLPREEAAVHKDQLVDIITLPREPDQ